jgi:formate-dependent nitrite reductase membrane component NrfD
MNPLVLGFGVAGVGAILQAAYFRRRGNDRLMVLSVLGTAAVAIGLVILLVRLD